MNASLFGKRPFGLRAVLLAVVWVAFAADLRSQIRDDSGLQSFNETQLQAIVRQTISNCLQRFADQQLKPDELALTLVSLNRAGISAQASYRGSFQIYPASVVKLFYLLAAHRWIEDGQLQETDELKRAMEDMIVHSYNEATHYIVDLLTSTTSGPELPPLELEEWAKRRDAVNRYLSSIGFTNINANKKPWCEGPYGRETQAITRFTPKRNLLTTDATARLLSDIALGKAVTSERSRKMLALLRRDPFRASTEPDDQARFIGQALDPGARLWSKAGWTSQTRHDAAYIELPNGTRFVLVIFTVNHANAREILPTLARPIIEAFAGVTPTP